MTDYKKLVAEALAAVEPLTKSDKNPEWLVESTFTMILKHMLDQESYSCCAPWEVEELESPV